jgi:hypothetical protein
LSCTMPLDVQRRLLEGSVHALVCIRMPDRRHASPRDETWLLQHQVEAALFGDNCTGAMYRLLARESLSLSPMPLKRKSVQDGLVLDAEYTELIRLLEECLPIESKGRVRHAPAHPHGILQPSPLGSLVHLP